MKSRRILSVLFSTVLLLNGIPKPVSADEPAPVTNTESVVVPYDEPFADQQPEASAPEEMTAEPLTENTEFIIAEEPVTEPAAMNDEDIPATAAEQPVDESAESALDSAEPASESTEDIPASPEENPVDEVDPTIESAEEPTVDSPEETEESVTEEEPAEEQLEEVQLLSNHQFSDTFSDAETSCTYNIVVSTTGDYVFSSGSFPIRVTVIDTATGGSEQLTPVLNDGSYQPINETVRLHKGKYLLQVQSILNQNGRFTLSVAYYTAEKTGEDDPQPSAEKPVENTEDSSEVIEAPTEKTAASHEDERTGSQADLARLVLQKLSAGQQNDQKQEDHEQVPQQDQADSVQPASSQASESIDLRETVLKLLQKRNNDTRTEQTSAQTDESDSAAGNDDPAGQTSKEPAEPDPVALTIEPADTTEQPAEITDETQLPDSAQSSPEPEQVEEEETSAAGPEAAPEEQLSQDQSDIDQPETPEEESQEAPAEEPADAPTEETQPDQDQSDIDQPETPEEASQEVPAAEIEDAPAEELQPEQNQPDTTQPETPVEASQETPAEESEDVSADDLQPAPAGPVITISYQIEENDDGETVVVLIADVEGAEGPYALQWQYSPDDGATIIDVENATGSEYRYILDEENALYSWRVIVTAIE